MSPHFRFCICSDWGSDSRDLTKNACSTIVHYRCPHITSTCKNFFKLIICTLIFIFRSHAVCLLKIERLSVPRRYGGLSDSLFVYINLLIPSLISCHLCYFAPVSHFLGLYSYLPREKRKPGNKMIRIALG